MVKNTKRVLMLFLVMLICLSSLSVFAAGESSEGTGGLPKNSASDVGTVDKQETNDKGFTWDDNEKDNAETFLKAMFLNEQYGNGNIMSAVNIATPFANLALTMTLVVLIIAFYFFIPQTAVDLFAILVPLSRSFLIRRTREKGSSNGMNMGSDGGGFMCLSDAAMEVIGAGSGSSSGGMSGSNMEQTSGGSKLVRYTIAKTKEMAVFMVFVLIFFTPLLGYVVMALFNFFSFVLAGVVNMFPQA